MAAGSYERKQFVGGAVPRELIGSMTTSSTSFSIDDATGWPDAVDPFVVLIDRGLDTEEKLLVNARSGTTLSSLTRGYDDTSARTHAAGAVVEHTIDASTIDQANRLANLLQVKGDLIGFDGVNPVRIPVGAAGGVLQSDPSEPGGVTVDGLTVVFVGDPAPAADEFIRFWYSEAFDMLFTSDGTSWLPSTSMPAVSSVAERNLIFGASPVQAGVGCLFNGRPQVWTGSAWIDVALLRDGIPKFVDAAARGAYFTSPSNGDHAYLTGTSELTEYRAGSWVTINGRVVVSDTAPSGLRDGDIWIQPT
jgi:hypothetical protein